ncbi:MAG: type IV pilus assembly protein PilM [Candidatus Omnitrophota bacterium]|jgi:type IV pilus assembly protein PilM
MDIFKKDHLIGLDIGSASAKIAQFTQKEGGLCLVRADLKEFGLTEDAAANEEAMLSALKSLFKGVDIKKSKIIVNVNSMHTAIKRVVAPYMPKTELMAGVKLEAKNYFPFSIDECMLDFEIAGDIVEKGVRKYETMVAVLPQKIVTQYLSLLGKMGIRPDGLICTSYALQKLAVYQSAKEGETKCFVDMGERYTELIITRGKHLMFSRKLPVAGGDFTKAMTEIVISNAGETLSAGEAEKLKKETGLPSDAELKIMEGKVSATQIMSVLRTPLEQLINEIVRSFDYYREESGGSKVDSVVLFGGGASLAGIIKLLSEELGVEVKLGDPVESINAEKGAVHEAEKNSHRLELAIAAALAGSKGINLLPIEIKEETKRVIKRGTAEAVITTAVTLAVLLCVGMVMKIDNLNKRIVADRMELASLSEQVEQSEAKRLAQTVLSDEPYWEDVFYELGNIMPNEIVMENIKMENRVIVMKGIVNSQDGQQIVADFIVSLEKGLFSGVRLIESKNLTDKPGIEFQISCWVDYVR